MVYDDTVAAYTDYHDAAAEAGLGEVGGTIAGGVAGTAMAIGDGILALGGNIVGLLGAGAETASSLWSWMTD